ncbi:glycosyltransferase involved in cell wall biosynthesis [Curtobacterium sp. PhB130]|uniref:glycosyltransferase family 2 protein n=1 Tax=Curtobacterium sp. PhB130 TaxID=2485178 RepID=UPI000FBEB362|nr:glycosyltransferase family 2 protein [Curtobacterium sp. PhB130]ROS75888.1 glycosyltransferase involved in cell wall biosynthesis [Curtobacterium sp. PhB130]
MKAEPFFSVVVPAYQVDSYLRECLESVLGQGFDELEVLAVNDGSPDESGSIIDSFASVDGRVRPIHLRRNGGLSNARNVGIAEATGRYVIFLDGDDALVPGALTAIADRIEALGRPDMLMYRFRHARPCGINKAKSFPAEIRDRDIIDVRAEPELLETLPLMAWDKAYSRDMVLDKGLQFLPGAYEDQPWSVAAFLVADAVGLLDFVCLNYRRCRAGSIITTPGPQHMDILDQFERMFEFVGKYEQANPQRVRRALHRRAAKYLHFLGYVKHARIPTGRLDEFRDRSVDLIRRFDEG